MKSEDITGGLDLLGDWLDYNPNTGVFIWLQNRKRAKAGTVAGYIAHGGYLYIKIFQKIYLAHRLAFLFMNEQYPDFMVDHINGDRTDNRWCNLRPASGAQNNANSATRKNSVSGLKGVSWFRHQEKWRARIRSNGKQATIGYFDCPAAAHFAYQVAADKLFGEYARAS